MSRETIAALPVEGRNVVHLLSLQPGAVFIPTTTNDRPAERFGRGRTRRPAERHPRRRRRQRPAAAVGVYDGGPHDAGGAAGVPRVDEQLWRGGRPVEWPAGVARDEERDQRAQRVRLLA